MKSLTLLLIPIIFLSSCTIDWSDEKDVKITELEKQVIEINNKIWKESKIIIPEYSFKTHIIQLWWIHSKIYDWVYWEIGRWSDSPQLDSMISDLPKWLIKLDYRGRKDFFTISCPEKFKIEKCWINWTEGVYSKNTCSFYFPENKINSDITFNCINDKFWTDL